MKSTNVLELNQSNKEYIYLENYNTIFEKNDLLDDILSRISKQSNEEIINELNEKYDTDDISNQISIIRDWFTKVDKHKEKIDKKFEINKDDWFNKKALTSLLINISHDCNLRCKYCYGDGGYYGKERELMTVERAKEIIDYWFKYLYIGKEKINVTFFGGEPLMNKEVLIFSVNYINDLLSKYKKSPNYGMTTNGTILDKDILELLVKNNFKLILSIDGGREIDNKNRPYVSGKGSFDTVKENIGHLKKYYSRLSARLTLTHEDVKDFAKSVKEIWNLGVQNVMYDIVSTNNIKFKLTKEDLKLLKPQIQELSEITYESMISDGNKILKPLLSISSELHNKIFNPGCPYDSKKILAVDPDGDIFKCHRLTGDSKFNVGNISTGLDWDKYNQHNKIICNDCWANNLCHKCAQANYVENGDVNKPYEVWCEHRKMLIKEGIKLYIKINNNHPDKVDKIYSRFY